MNFSSAALLYGKVGKNSIKTNLYLTKEEPPDSRLLNLSRIFFEKPIYFSYTLYKFK